jgi:hypothetical protein
MNALKLRPLIQMLIVSEEWRLGCEQIEASYASPVSALAAVKSLDDRQSSLTDNVGYAL